ncbi:MAG: hypothetical protein K2Q07_05455 [Burkholderiaceae bacterium]|nr:hypothetical protein [Burkholderiaceae bacterium]
MSDGPRLAWWCKTEDLQLASVRMRTALLMPMLSQQGISSEWFRQKNLLRYRCIVVRKRYDDATLHLLRGFKQQGGRLVLDLCDNDFTPKSPQPRHLHEVENLRRLAEWADVIVASSEPLAQIVARECPAAGKVTVIGEVPDDPSIANLSLWARAWGRWTLAREQACLDRIAPVGVTRLVWFGIASKRHQPNAGMGELASIVPMLVALNRTFPLHLTVISDNARRFRQDIAPQMPSSRYIAWQPSTIEALLRQQHIALIPSSPEASAACKSDNRVVTALRAGLAVVADPVPSYLPHGEVIRIGPMEAGLRHYLAHPEQRIADAARGRSRVTQSGHAERVLAQWIEVCGL